MSQLNPTESQNEEIFTPIISDHVKTIAYFATDLVQLASVFVLTILALYNVMPGVLAIGTQAAITTLMQGTKLTFRLSAKKQ